MKDQIIMHCREFDPEKAEFDLTPNVVGKPQKAMWSSTMMNPITKTGWLEWSYYEDFFVSGNKSVFHVTPKENVKVLTINSMEDIKRYLPLLKDNFNRIYFDYKKLAKEYDGVNFTIGAIALGKIGYPPIDVPMWLYMTLNAFDCESTVWFNNKWIENYTYIGEIKDIFRRDKVCVLAERKNTLSTTKKMEKRKKE